jgi:hypothetical protein
MTVHVAKSVTYPKVLLFIYGEDSFHIKVVNKYKLLT